MAGVNSPSHLFRPKRESPAFAGEMAIKSPSPASLPCPSRQPRLANQLVNRVVQKPSFCSPEFIGFFAPIFANRDGPLATPSKPAFGAKHLKSIPMRLSRNVASFVPEEYNSAVLGCASSHRSSQETALPAERPMQDVRIPPVRFVRRHGQT